MNLIIEGKVGKRGTLYLPRSVVKALNLKEGMKIRYTIEGDKLIMKPIFNPFDLALSGPKFAETTVEEFERESEEMQSELFKAQSPP